MKGIIKVGVIYLDAENVVKMENISIEFPGVKALDDVSFDLKKGEVHVLLGENGAGKSTLMKILSGVYKRSTGTVYLNGKRIDFQNPKQAMDAGIATIYQELNLIPYLTVAENIFVGRQPKKGMIVDWKTMFSNTQKILDRLESTISPWAKVGDLTVAMQQMIEIAKAISANADVIIMDEPTSALTENEIDELFKVTKSLTAQGVAVVYISHRLEEVKQIGDRATVLRDGKLIDTVNISDVTLDDLIRMMVGRNLTDKFPKIQVPIGEELLRVEHISTKDKLIDCSFNLKKGEILGVAGLMGAGRTELMHALTGADKKTAGEVFLEEKKATIHSFKDAVKNGIGLLTEDRKRQGLVLMMDVKSNITLVSLRKVMKRGWIQYKVEERESQKYVDMLSIKTPSLYQKAVFLSGGNQQKVVLAKWLFSDCKIIIFDEPTRGIDVGAKVEICKLMNELVKEGIGVIMISSELPEILGMSDRIIVMHEGRITGELAREDATQEKILYLATGGDELHAK
ncbi:MAG: sugar ABC transporter ATP-binding protein [Christensenellales bacterium]